ncbi:MAG: D-sedoheptulose 7-phosphate isomerase [Odoribacter sp.]|nr:D-sedoheptulose 7-phosphate isomerase [Odoribacter sp.]
MNKEYMDLIQNSLEQASRLLAEFIAEDGNIEKIRTAAGLMTEALRNKGKIISCGNGGSLCDAMHFAEELTGRFRHDREALPAVAIADPAHITCVGNDYGFDYIFSKYLEAHGKAGDVLLAISTSGNSVNILKATDEARRKGMKIVGLTGKDGGEMRNKCDVCIVVPWHEYSDRIQEIHIKIIHILIECIEKQLLSTDTK